MQTKFEEDGISGLGRVNTVELSGNYRQMGRQYGSSLKEKIAEFYDLAINRLFIKEFGMTYQNIENIAFLVFKHYPDRFKEMIIGIAEGSGFGLEKIAILQQMTVLAEFAEPKGCSNMVVWGEHSADRRLHWGRTFDMPVFYRKFAEYLTVITCRPSDSHITATAIAYAGQIDAYTVMNNHGLFISIDEAIISAGNSFAHDRIPVSIIPLALALDYSDAEALGSALNTIRPGWPVIITMGDKNSARSYEFSISEGKRTDAFKDGVLVATNHFVNPSWGIGDPLVDKGFSVLRRSNLLGYSDRHKGAFDHRKMTEVLDTPVDRGGVHRPQTAYQLVATPEDLKMWLKVPDLQDWVELDAGVSEQLAV